MLCEQILENRRLMRHKHFLSYAWAQFRRTGAYGVWRSTLSYVRKIRVVTIVIRISTIVLTAVQAGALVLLSTVLFLIVIPILSAFMLGVLITAQLESRKSNRYLARKLAGKKVYVLFLSKQENPFFRANTELLAREPTSAVIIVSPYWLAGKGLRGKRFYCTMRRESSCVFLVRRYYFFRLKKEVLTPNTTYVY